MRKKQIFFQTKFVLPPHVSRLLSKVDLKIQLRTLLEELPLRLGTALLITAFGRYRGVRDYRRPQLPDLPLLLLIKKMGVCFVGFQGCVNFFWPVSLFKEFQLSALLYSAEISVKLIHSFFISTWPIKQLKAFFSKKLSTQPLTKKISTSKALIAGCKK